MTNTNSVPPEEQKAIQFALLYGVRHVNFNAAFRSSFPPTIEDKQEAFDLVQDRRQRDGLPKLNMERPQK